MSINAIIIGQNYSTSIGIINAIGIDGYRSATIKRVTHKPLFPTPELVSKYIEKYEYTAVRPGKQLIDVMINQYAQRDNKIVIIPSDDYCAALIDKYRRQLAPFFVIPGIENGPSVEYIMDKEEQKKAAIRHGILTARYSLIHIEEDTYELPEIKFPCITKPKKSIEGSKKNIRVCQDNNELEEVLANVIKSGGKDILAEEIINYEHEYTVPGLALPRCVYIPALLKKTHIGQGEHRGVTGAGEVVPIENSITIIENIKKLILDIGFVGIFDVELFEKDNQYYFNELNLRNGAAGYALTAAGANIPAAYMEWAKTGKTKFSFKPESLSFVSEKVILESYEAGLISWHDYKKIVKSADVRLVNNINDKSSRRAFRLLECKAILRVLRNKIRKKLIWNQ